MFDKKVLMLLIVLVSLSCLSSVWAMDCDNTTDDLIQSDVQDENLEMELENNEVLAKSNDTNALASQHQNAQQSSASKESATYLVLDNDADKENIYIGDYVTWIVSVSNNGQNKAKNVRVFDKLPDGLEYVRHKTTQGTFDPKTGIWDIGDLSIGREVFLYITTLATSVGEKINKATLASDTPNLNNETYEEEEIDVFNHHEEDNSKQYHESSIRPAGNPVGLVLLSLFGCFSVYIKKR